MNADKLLKNLIADGADESGIQDRFGGNVDLYEECFRDFIEEPHFLSLRDALQTQSYEQAFNSAHALKGLSGNLGLSAFYDAVCVLVESLRHKQYGSVDAEYAQVERQHERLRQLLSGEPVPQTVSAAGQPARAGEKSAAPKGPDDELDKKNGRLSRAVMCAAFVIILAIGLLFVRVNTIHNENVLEESSQHLIEMTRQIRLYIEEHIANDWKIANSIGDSIAGSNYSDDRAAVLDVLRRRQKVWDVTDLMLYTENGYCVYADGDAEMNGVASDTLYYARKYGRYLSIIDSRLIYTIPIETQQQYAGSRIVAVSVVRDMSSFLDDMLFSSFDNKAWMYLTDQNGIIISSLTNPSTRNVFNIRSAVADMSITPLDGACSAEDFLTDPKEAAFLLEDAFEKDYGVSTPILTGAQTFHLFYFVPEDAVNNTMNGFSKQLIIFSMVIILIFTTCAIIASWYVYESRKRLFDKALLTRERMFDLLVKNTKTAFGLFTVGQAPPEYTSDNVSEVVGDKYWVLEREGSGYALRNDSDTETENISRVNELIRGWDGHEVFRSGYLRKGLSNSAPYFEFALYPVGDEGRDFVGVAQDVTEAHAREEATRTAMDMATSSNEAKTRFLSNMSHDIRTPMNAIMNMSNFALESVDQPKKLGPYLRTIHESAEHLLQLINDVLDVSRIESGQMVVASAPFDLRAEVQRQADMIRPLCAAKGQTLMVELDGVGAQAVCGDALKVSQVIMNLLSNAMKFTPERGAIRLTAKELPSLRDGIVNIRFTVEDTGIGISEADRKHIFEPFSRAEDKEVRRIEGTGLGLSICKSYVEAMGGTIRCDSELGEGSTFTVELFFQQSSGQLSRSSPGGAYIRDSFLGMRCLVAEDNATNKLIAGELLKRMGFIVDYADDGAEAVRKFCGSAPGAYDVIYMDIQMPVMDGYEAAVSIRASEHPQAQTIPIVAMTANAFAEDVEKARVAGMDAYVDKPIVSFNLSEQTERALRRKRTRTDE